MLAKQKTCSVAYFVFVYKMGVSHSAPAPRPPLGKRVVVISDTHGKHSDLAIPDGDILIHAGDFTRFGKEEDAVDFNEWLGKLSHRHKIIIEGNHEANAPWKDRAYELLSNATFLKKYVVHVPRHQNSRQVLFLEYENE